MFRRFASSSLRRCIHTSSTRSAQSSTFPRLGFALGASTVAATYLALHLSSDSNKIFLDGPSSSKNVPQPTSDFRYPTFTPPHQPPPQPRPVEAATVAPPSQESEFVPDEPESASEPSLKDSAESQEEPSTSAETTAAAGDGEGSSEQPASGGGAYDPVTGEINWDCPCLGGMAHEDEPKGINCVDKFKAMQNCFREHPEIYAEEIMDDDEEPEAVAIAESAAADEVRPPPQSDKYEKPVEHVTSHPEEPVTSTPSTPSSPQ
ncbi:hypothetical protein ONZ45_g14532 [Pleurotus djamor]|nr:hypothetical protein ONZ45_g14532 [Pleurotus djamor]